MEESDIVEQSFPLIFAFDEIVALGYRENVNLAQIRTFTEMDSHEEKVYVAVRQVIYLFEENPSSLSFRFPSIVVTWMNQILLTSLSH